MRIRLTVGLSALALCTSCYQFEITAQGGYAQLALDGDLGYVNGTSQTAVQQDIQSGFGLGDDQGSPYARVAMDFGVPVLAASGFLFEDEGRGVLQQNFGNVTAGLTVLSDFELKSAKVSYTFDIPIVIGTIAPGVAVNFVDLSIFVRDTLGVASEDVQLQAPLPMAYLRGEIDAIPFFQLVGEVGYIKVDVEDVEASMLDVEALVEFTGLEPLNLFVGYRSIRLQGEGEIDSDNVDIDIGLGGFLVGGGIRF
ncbi:MAG: hypothetical protein KDE27_33190 [Planctomycetes bacterium]|nr:hypothetical protein [Planctomycetota bacterium]